MAPILLVHAGLPGPSAPIWARASCVGLADPQGPIGVFQVGHCPASMASSISAMFNQLPCLGGVQLQPLGQPPGLGRWERRIQRRGRVN
jgi:hypothetical protein